MIDNDRREKTKGSLITNIVTPIKIGYNRVRVDQHAPIEGTGRASIYFAMGYEVYFIFESCAIKPYR